MNMKGFQLQEYRNLGGMSVIGTHPKVYPSRTRAMLALVFSFGWLFESWRIVPVKDTV